jgi:hypothetical protein
MPRDFLAVVISAISLVVSFVALSWTIGWSIWLYVRSRRPQLKVDTSHALASFPSGPQDCITTSITNTGVIPVTLRAVFSRVKGDRRKLSLIPVEWMHCNLPHRLEVGEHWDAPLIPPQSLRQSLAESFPEYARGNPPTWSLITFARDASGREHASKILKV